MIILLKKQEGESGYIMAKKSKRVLSFALVPFVCVNIFAGCKMSSKNEKVFASTSKPESSITQEVVNEDCNDFVASTVNNTNINDVKKQNEDPFKILLDLYDKSGLQFNEILTSYSRSDDLYASALYVKLLNSGMNQEEIENQLLNVITMGSIAVDVDEETWNNLFDSLISTINEYDNPIEYYYPLAKYVHYSTCNLKHYKCYEDDERVYCDTIDNNLMTLHDGALKEYYIIRKIYESNDFKVLEEAERIYNNSLSISEVSEELDRIYLLSIIPTELDEETWNKMFNKLLTTVSEKENVCTTYYDLACYIHKLTCDNEHKVNEYGAVECEEYKLKLN